MIDQPVHRRRFLALLGAGAGAAAAGTSSVLSGASAWADSGGSKSGPHFSYEGPTRAARWGSLSPQYRACSAGNSQTPINVISGNVEPSASSAQLHYQGVAATAINNGHTLMINTKSGASIVVDGASYDLKQFHYHTPSEHTYDGRPFMVEWHFVHQNSAGNTAAVAVMANVGASSWLCGDPRGRPDRRRQDQVAAGARGSHGPAARRPQRDRLRRLTHHPALHASPALDTLRPTRRDEPGPSPDAPELPRPQRPPTPSPQRANPAHPHRDLTAHPAVPRGRLAGWIQSSGGRRVEPRNTRVTILSRLQRDGLSELGLSFCVPCGSGDGGYRYWT